MLFYDDYNVELYQISSAEFHKVEEGSWKEKLTSALVSEKPVWVSFVGSCYRWISILERSSWAPGSCFERQCLSA